MQFDLFSQTTKGPIVQPDLMLIYAPEGTGKTTFAVKAPSPYFFDLEKGTRSMDVARWDKAKTIGDVFQAMNQFYTTKHEFKTLVIDSLSELERLITKQVVQDEGVTNIEQVGGGFGKGDKIALNYWEQFRNGINILREHRGINIIMTAHADVKTFTDPATNSAYDRYQLRLAKGASAMIREWVEFVGFGNFVTYTKGKENAKHKAYGDGVRKLYTERRPAFDAKNRLGLPLEMDLDYEAYKNFSTATPASKAKQIRENIVELLGDSTNEEFKKLVTETVAKAGDNHEGLAIIQERVRVKLKEEQDNGLPTTAV